MSNASKPFSTSRALPPVVNVLARFIGNVLLREMGRGVTRYGDVLELARSTAVQATRGRLVMCGVNNDIGGIAGYLGLLAANAAPMMVNPTLSPNALDPIIAAYGLTGSGCRNSMRVANQAQNGLFAITTMHSLA